MKGFLRLLLVAAILAFVSPALGASDLLDRALGPADKDRLARFNKVRAASIEAARKGGEPADMAMLDKILGGDAEPILGLDLRGNYGCRTAKLGGNPPLVIYGWFKCEIAEDDIGYVLRKLTGSQRLSGHFVDDAETSLVFYGARHYSDEAPKGYGADPARDAVGRFVKVGEDRFRLELPLPQLESKFDIIELEAR